MKALKIILLLCLTQSAFAQEPQYNEKDSLLRTDFLNRYGKYTEVVALESKVTFSFKKSFLGPTGFAVTEKYQENFCSMRDDYTLNHITFFDEQSTIMECKRSRQNKSKANRYVSPAISDYESQGIFYSDLKLAHMQLGFADVCDTRAVQVIKEYTDPKFLTDVQFRRPFPCESRIIEFVVPAWIDMEIIEMNFDQMEISRTEVKKGGNNIITFTANKIDNRIDEGGSPGPTYYEPHIVLVFKGYKSYGNGEPELVPFLSSTDDLYKWYSSLVEVEELTDEMKEKVEQLTKGKTTDEEKAKAIFYWVQDNVRYIAFEDGIMGFKPEDADDVFEQKYGDCKGMANLTKTLLKEVGLDARLTWIGTNRKSPAYNYSIPNLAVDNHMICTVIIDGERYFLDGTEKFIGLGEYAARIQGRPVLIEDGDNYIIDTVPYTGNVRNETKYNRNLRIDKDKLIGTCDFSVSGEEKVTLLNIFSMVGTNSKKELVNFYLTTDDKDVTITKLQEPGEIDRDKSLDFQFDFEGKNMFLEVGNEIFLNMEFDRDYGESDGRTDRETDIQLEYEFNVNNLTVLDVPAGYTVNHLPPDVDIDTEWFSMKLKYTVKDGKVSYKKTLIAKQRIFPKEMLQQWNDAIVKLRDSYNDHVVLVKQ